MKKTYGYARVSTREQHLDRQLKALMDAGVEERDIITDKVSGKDLEREGYRSLKNHFLRDGDTLIVKSLDRLSRRKIDIKKELEYFREHHIRIKILDIPTTMVELPDEQDWIFEMIQRTFRCAFIEVHRGQPPHLGGAFAGGSLHNGGQRDRNTPRSRRRCGGIFQE